MTNAESLVVKKDDVVDQSFFFGQALGLRGQGAAHVAARGLFDLG